MKKYFTLLLVLFLNAEARNQIEIKSIQAEYYPCGNCITCGAEQESTEIADQIQKICEVTYVDGTAIGDGDGRVGLSSCNVPVTIFKNLAAEHDRMKIYHPDLNNDVCFGANARLEVKFKCLNDNGQLLGATFIKSVVHNGGSMQLNCEQIHKNITEEQSYTPFHFTESGMWASLGQALLNAATFSIIAFAFSS